jgi:hypothetical protein
MAGIGSGYGIMTVKNNDQISAEEREEALEQTQTEQEHVTSSLAAHCRKEWMRARDSKQPIEREMIRDLRQREGKYDDTKLEAIRQMGGSEIKMMVTDLKCRAAISWLRDILFGSGERPFSCENTPIPEIPPEIEEAIGAEAYQELQMVMGAIPHPRELRERIEAYKDELMKHARREAKRQAKRMEDKIEDEYIQGDFYEALDDFLEDFTTHKTGIIRGPVIRNKLELQWAKDNNPMRPNGLKAIVNKRLTRTYYAVSPFDVYLTPEARHFQEGTLIERHRFDPDQISQFLGSPGYNDAELRKALDQFADHGLVDWLWYDFERSRLEGRPYDQIYDSGNMIDTLEFHTKVRGKWLREWGSQEQVDDELWYDANVWLIGQYVIKATLNDDPMRRRNYHTSSYVTVRNSPWGRGVPSLMTDLQDMCDSCARALSNNMGIASGPQAEIFVDRLPEGEDISKMYPWKIWQTVSNKYGTPGPAVNFFQPDVHAEVLMKVFEFFSSLADEYTGIPRYMSGEGGQMGGAGRTASGLSMLMNNSSRLMKGVIANCDHVIISTTKTTHRHILLYDDEMEHKGDVKVVAKASQALLHRESQQLRINETLQNTMNPVDFQIMGPEGRLELLRGALRGIDAIDVEKVLPTNDEMLMRAMAQQLPPPNQPENAASPQGENPGEGVQGMAA